MQIRGFRAIYGDAKGAHDLLSTASAIASEAAQLTRFTDIPSQAPANTIWQPFLRGFKFKSYYVFIKTFADATASRRGMVLSEAIFYPLVEIISLADIEPLLTAFSATLSLAKTETRQDFSLSVRQPTETARRNLPTGLITLLNEFLEAGVDESLVWLGQDNFPAILAALWHYLLPLQREKLSFRFCFVPQNFGSHYPSLIYTLPEMTSRWVAYHRISPPVGKETSASKAVAFLLGEATGAEVKEFFTKLEIEPTDWNSLRMCQECVAYELRREDGTITVSEFRGLINRITVLSPDKRKGGHYKQDIFRKFCEMLLREGTCTDFFAVSPMDFTPFQNSEKLLTTSVSDWLRTHLFELSAAELKRIVERAEEIPTQIWGQAVYHSLAESSARLTKPRAEILWVWWQAENGLFDLLGKNLLQNRQANEIIYATCPRRLPPALGAKMVVCALNEQNWRLAALLYAAYLPSEEAIKQQLKNEPVGITGQASGLPIICERVPLAAVLEVFLQVADERLLPILVAKLSAHDSLLLQRQLRQTAWQKLTLAMLETGEIAFWNNAPLPQKLVFDILRLQTSGELAEPKLLSFAARSPFASLLNYPERKEVWSYLPFAQRESFLARTAEAWWLLSLEHQQTEQLEVLEQELRQVVLAESTIRQVLSKVDSPVDALLKIFQSTPSLSEQKCSQLLSCAVEKTWHINSITAIELGRFVSYRQWKDVAKNMLRLVDYHRRSDLRPAVAECAELFRIWDTLFSSTLSGLRQNSVNWSEWNEAFDACLIELYQEGPTQGNLWQRAGGDIAVLLRHCSGRETWRAALQKLRQGGGGQEISTVRIIEEAQRDYPKNEKLRLLKQLFHKLEGKY